MHVSCRKLIVFWSGLCTVLLALASRWIDFDAMDVSRMLLSLAVLVGVALLWLFPTVFIGLVAVSTRGRR